MALPNDTVTTNIVPVQGIFKPGPTFDLITFIGPAGTPFLPPSSPFLNGVTITNSTIDSTVIGGSVPAAGNFTNIFATTGQVATLPSNSTDIANKQYVDSVAQGLDIKAACLFSTIGNITLSGLGTQAGGDWSTALPTGSRILVKNQTNAAQNGIYVAVSGTWTRAIDMSTWAQVPAAFTFIEEGTTLSDTGWVCTSNPGGTMEVTAITWAQFSGAGSYLAGTGLTLTGNTFSITNTTVVAGSYGSASNVATFAVNAQGQLTSASNTPIAIAASQITSGTIASSLISGSYTGITGVGTLTAGTWNASPITNSYLANSSLTINGTTISLGGSGTITAAAPFALTIGTGLSGGSYNGSAAVTIANTGVLTFSGGTTGLTPNSATAGAVTLGGILGIANGGTNSTATPTAGAVAYGNGTAYAFTAAGTAGQFLQSTGGGTPTWSTPTSGSFQPAYYATFVSTANQANGGSTTANAVSFDTVALANGISITSSNQLTFANAGQYVIEYELAVASTSGANSSISAWLAKNGTNIANTTSDLTILGGANQPQLLEQQWIVNVSAGDYIQIYWSSSSTNVSLVYQGTATSPTRPASPSATVNIAFIPPSGSNLVVNSSTITGGTSGYVLYDNAGTVGEIAKSALAVGTATNLAGGGAGYVPYQSAAGTTLFVSAGTTGQVLTSNGSGAPTWTTPTAYATVTDDTTTNAVRYPLFANQTTGNLSTEYTSSTKYQFNPSTGVLTATGFSGSGASLTNLTAGNLTGTIPSSVLGNSTVYIGTTAIALNRASGAQTLTGTSIDGSAASATSATNATNVGVTDNTTTNATYYPTFVSSTTGNLPINTSSTKLQYNPNTGVYTAPSFSGAGTGLTGTASGLSIGGNAATATSATTATNVAGGTAGALHYQSAASTTTFLALGTTNYVLTAGATAPQYVAQSSLSVGSATTAGSVTNSLTFNSSGTGAASGTAYNGSAAYTISYNTIGASPLAGSTSLTTLGTVTTGTWNATPITNSYLANSSITINGNLVSLGGSTTVTANTPNALSVGTGLSMSPGASFNGSAAQSIAISNTGVTAGTYGSATSIPTIQVNAQGQITSITTNTLNSPAYQGTWNASTNSPTLTSSVGTNNNYYIVSTAGTTTLNGISLWSVGDWVIFNGTTNAWQKIDGSSNEAFNSITVTGLTGYMYANGTSAVTASTTIPFSAISGTVSTSNSLTFNNGGAGAASGTTFNGSAAQTISYNTIGAPSTTGTNASGTWGISISGNAATATSATSATSATNTGITANSTDTADYLTFVSGTSGNLPQLVNSSITVNPSKGTITGGIGGGAF